MKIKSKRTQILFWLTVLFSHVVVAQQNGTNDAEAKIDSIFSIYENRPGCAIAVVKNGKTIFQKGYGLSNLEYEIPVNSKTVFDGSAVAKQFTAACIFLLEQEGKLSLDDSIQKFFPELPRYNEGKITIKNLLYQTSGLRSYLAILFAQNRYFGDRITNHDAIELITNQRNLNFRTGIKHDYSNSNYVLLANIVEIASGKKFNEYAKVKLFDPLQMSNTFFDVSSNKVIKNRAIAYEQEGDNFMVNHFFNPTVVGDGGLHTNLEDVVKWSNNLNATGILGKEVFAKMITPGTLNSGVETNYAGGLYRQNHYDIDGLSSIRHSGAWAGFRSLYYKFLEQDIAFIFLSNNANTNAWVLLDQLTPLFLAEEIATMQGRAAANSNTMTATEAVLSLKEKKKFVGSFYNKIDGSLRSIELVDDVLFYKRLPNVPGSPLLTLSPTELAFRAAPHLKLSFKPTFDGGMTLTVNNQEPTLFERYEAFTYDEFSLSEYRHNYYNEDLDVIYQIKSKENQLQILIQGKELVVLDAFSKDMFREEHFGYIEFLRDEKGVINGFRREDNTFSNLTFKKVKNSYEN